MAWLTTNCKFLCTRSFVICADRPRDSAWPKRASDSGSSSWWWTWWCSSRSASPSQSTWKALKKVRVGVNAHLPLLIVTHFVVFSGATRNHIRQQYSEPHGDHPERKDQQQRVVYRCVGHISRLSEFRLTLGISGIAGTVVSSRCMLVNVPLCLKHKVPYNYTSFPNLFDQISQREAAEVSTMICVFWLSDTSCKVSNVCNSFIFDLQSNSM
jgi:hypothetical protein